MLILAVDLDLGEELEVGHEAASWANVLDAVEDLLLCTRFLLHNGSSLWLSGFIDF